MGTLFLDINIVRISKLKMDVPNTVISGTSIYSI